MILGGKKVEQNEFLTKMMEILDVEDELTMETELSSFDEWDSLAVLTFLAEMSSFAKNPLKTENVKKAKTIVDLYELLG